MRKHGGYCLAAALVTIFLLSGPSATMGVTYAQLYAAKRSEQHTQGQLQVNWSQMSNAEKQLSALKLSLNELDEAISLTNKKISDQQTSLNALKAQEIFEEHKREQLVQQFNAILINTYENGGTLTYLSVLIHATSWVDFLTRLHEVKLILSHNYDIQQQIIQENQLIQSEEATINAKMASLQETVNEDNRLARLKEQSAAREKNILSGLSRNQRLLEEEKARQLARINDIQRELWAQEQEALLYARYGAIRGSRDIPLITKAVHVGAGGISSMIDYAQSYLGTPYVWGGTTPHPGFDCSGFTQYVLHHIGVNIQRTSEQQYNEGIPVARNQLEPGDLVFFTTYAPGASHVGIYIGNGLMIDAEDYGVVFDNINDRYWSPRYLGAKRIVEP